MMQKRASNLRDDKIICRTAGIMQALVSAGIIIVAGREIIEVIYRELILQNNGKFAELGRDMAIIALLILLGTIVVILASGAMIYLSERRTELLCKIEPLIATTPVLFALTTLVYMFFPISKTLFVLIWLCIVFISFQGAAAYRRICRAPQHLV